jgi:hypothetical protein
MSNNIFFAPGADEQVRRRVWQARMESGDSACVTMTGANRARTGFAPASQPWLHSFFLGLSGITAVKRIFFVKSSTLVGHREAAVGPHGHLDVVAVIGFVEVR